MIMSRVAENQGKGLTSSSQQVSFPRANQALEVVEKWTVEGEDACASKSLVAVF